MLFFRIEAIKRALDENNYWRECRCFLNLQIETQGKKPIRLFSLHQILKPKTKLTINTNCYLQTNNGNDIFMTKDERDRLP